MAVTCVLRHSWCALFWLFRSQWIIVYMWYTVRWV